MRIRCLEWQPWTEGNWPWRQLRGGPPIHELTSCCHGQVVGKQLRKPADVVKACGLVRAVEDSVARLLAKQLRLYNAGLRKTEQALRFAGRLLPSFSSRAWRSATVS